MASCNFCVSYGQKKKLLSVSSSGPEELLQNLKPKIESKFSLGNQAYTMKLKLEQFQTYVDIDEDDMDDVKLLQNGGSIILEQIITNMEPSLQSPQRSPATVDATPSADGLHLQCSTSSDVSTSPSDKDARGPAQSPSLKVKGFDVREMVKKHPRGPLIEAEYATNQTITTETRHLLTTIVAAEMVKIYSYYPTREEKITVAKSIITAYPSLRSTSSRYPYDIWYDETDSSRGYLSTKLNTMRRSLPQELQQRPRTGKYAGLVKAPKKEELKRTYQQLEVVTSEEEAELVHFCKRASVDSRDEVLEGMRKTFQNRRNWIAETMPSVIQILERYPRFQDTPTVVQQEFKLLLPEATAKLISKWETRFMQSILHICKMSRLPKIQALMKDLYHPASESGDQYEPSDGEMSLYALLGAVYLLPSNAAKRTSLADAVQYFLVTRPPGTSVESFIREQRKDGKLKRSQPYLLGTGSRRLPTQFFVIIDEEAIPCCGDITSAVDVLYKLHFVFNIEYATELKAFYAFLDHFVYEVGLPKVVIPARAKELMASIKALSNK